MKKINITLISGIFWIGFWVVLAYMDVGKPARISIVTEWYHVIYIGLVFLFPFLVGWLSHKEHIGQ